MVGNSREIVFMSGMRVGALVQAGERTLPSVPKWSVTATLASSNADQSESSSGAAGERPAGGAQAGSMTAFTPASKRRCASAIICSRLSTMRMPTTRTRSVPKSLAERMA